MAPGTGGSPGARRADARRRAGLLEVTGEAHGLDPSSLEDDLGTHGTAAEAVEGLGTWWTDREADVRAQLGL